MKANTLPIGPASGRQRAPGRTKQPQPMMAPTARAQTSAGLIVFFSSSRPLSTCSLLMTKSPSLSSRFKSGFFALFFVHRRIPALNEKGRIIQKLYWNVGIVPEGTNSLASAEPKYLNRHCKEAFIRINRL